MSSSLAHRHGVVWISRSAGVARLVPYDLGGRRIGSGFTIRGSGNGPADVRGIGIDEDRRVWAADAGSGAVRAFTAFGAECGRIPDPAGELADAAGIAVQGVESELLLLVSRRGERRHGLFLVDPREGSTRSLRPEGDPAGSFANLAGVALAGRLAFACEAGRGYVQVFRDGEYHFRISFGIAGSRVRAEPRVVAATRDGRSVVAGRTGDGGAVLLFDGGGGFACRLDLELEAGADSVDDDVSGVVVEEGASDRDSVVLVLDRAGSRVLAFTFDGRCLGVFHDLEVDADGRVEASDAVRLPRPRSRRRT